VGSPPYLEDPVGFGSRTTRNRAIPDITAIQGREAILLVLQRSVISKTRQPGLAWIGVKPELKSIEQSIEDLARDPGTRMLGPREDQAGIGQDSVGGWITIRAANICGR